MKGVFIVLLLGIVLGCYATDATPPQQSIQNQVACDPDNANSERCTHQSGRNYTTPNLPEIPILPILPILPNQDTSVNCENEGGDPSKTIHTPESNDCIIPKSYDKNIDDQATDSGSGNSGSGNSGSGNSGSGNSGTGNQRNSQIPNDKEPYHYGVIRYCRELIVHMTDFITNMFVKNDEIVTETDNVNINITNYYNHYDYLPLNDKLKEEYTPQDDKDGIDDMDRISADQTNKTMINILDQFAKDMRIENINRVNQYQTKITDISGISNNLGKERLI